MLLAFVPHRFYLSRFSPSHV